MRARSLTDHSRLACCALLVGGASSCSVYGADLQGAAPAVAGSSASAGASGMKGEALGDAGADSAGATAEDAGAANSGGGAGAGGSPGTASGGNAGAAGSAAGAGNTAGAPLVDPNLIDDLEDGDRNIQIIHAPRRDGIWDVNNDQSASGTQTPEPGAFLPTLLAAADRPYASDKWAAYTKGNGFSSFGAYMNVSMRSWATYADTPAYDASGYTGLTFLAKVGSDASTTNKMRVRFISGDTDPRLGKCKLSDAVPTPTHDELCYNHYYADVTLDTAWDTYTLAFKDFVQGTDGKLNDAIDLEEMYGLEFYFTTGVHFEVWVDDLKFTSAK